VRTQLTQLYLATGGYAHVYLTHSDTPLGPNKLTTHCLKRLAFRQEQAPDIMKDVEKEIEVMKALRGNPWIVEYLGSEVRRTPGGAGKGPGWEVFILMEFCAGESTKRSTIKCVHPHPVTIPVTSLAGGGIIDLLNKRLRDRLKEQEILSIFVDVCEAVAYMHSLPRPLLHRDLKVSKALDSTALSLTHCVHALLILLTDREYPLPSFISK
jgi:AP2-associated kinase